MGNKYTKHQKDNNYTKFWYENLKEDLGVNGKTTIKRFLKETGLYERVGWIHQAQDRDH
jgi:hypothetical protein